MLFGETSATFLIKVFGVLYPSYASYKALKSEGGSVADCQFWLQYFIIYSVLLVLESMFDLVGGYVPFYYELKVAFVIWLQLERTRGAALLYSKLIAPHLSQHEEQIDGGASFMISKAKDVKREDVWDASKQLSEWVKVQSSSLKSGRPASPSSPEGQEDKPADSDEGPEEIRKEDAVEESKKAQ